MKNIEEIFLGIDAAIKLTAQRTFEGNFEHM